MLQVSARVLQTAQSAALSIQFATKFQRLTTDNLCFAYVK